MSERLQYYPSDHVEQEVSEDGSESSGEASTTEEQDQNSVSQNIGTSRQEIGNKVTWPQSFGARV